MHSSVSVVITTYNRPDFLHQALKSVIEQTVIPTEIIVVDDCSPTSFKSILSDFDETPIVYHRLERNSGANHARNIGVSLAKGEWVAFLDDDDAWLPHKLEKQLNSLKDESTSVGCLCSFSNMETLQAKPPLGASKVTAKTLRAGNPYCGMSGVLARREVLLNEPFDESLPCAQDWDLFIRLAQKGTLLYVDEPLFLRRMGSYESITRKAACSSFADIQPRLAAARKHRNWMGEKNFRDRVANMVLAYLSKKPRKCQWVLHSIQQAGVRATVTCMHAKLTKKSLY